MARKEAWRPNRRPRFLSVSMRGDDRLLRSGVVTVSWLGCGGERVRTPQRKSPAVPSHHTTALDHVLDTPGVYHVDIIGQVFSLKVLVMSWRPLITMASKRNI